MCRGNGGVLLLGCIGNLNASYNLQAKKTFTLYIFSLFSDSALLKLQDNSIFIIITMAPNGSMHSNPPTVPIRSFLMPLCEKEIMLRVRFHNLQHEKITVRCLLRLAIV